MTEAKHTRGPWRVAPVEAPDRKGVWDVFAADFDYPNAWWVVAKVYGYRQHSNAEPDARLIAAAPDLLAACKAALNEVQRIGTEPGSLERQYQNAAVRYLLAAIAKTEVR